MEGTPNTLYEALAVGNAVVASTADGQGEILTDGQTALMFEPGDVSRMNEQLQRVLSDNALRGELEQAAHTLSADFDGHRTIETMQNTYQTIMAERNGNVG
jgi:glycosyltransferase involved in cell wall biosynthesis